MHKAIKALRNQAQPILAKIKAGDSVSPQEIEHATEMYELAYYLSKFEGAPGDARHSDGGYKQYLGDELDGAEEYLTLWQETGNADFKAMARDELRHFELLVKYIRMQDPDADMSACMTRHGALLAKLA